jgi:hypothetical protein
LNELWSDRLIEILIANPSKLHSEHEVLHCDLQELYYDLGYMHILTPQIKADIEFKIGINVKLKPRKLH